MSSLDAELLALVLDHSPGGLLLVQSQTMAVCYANLQAHQLLGYPAPSLVDKPITEIESALEDLFFWEEVQSGTAADIDDQPSQYLCQDGSLLDVRKSVRRVEAQGQRYWLIHATASRGEQPVQDVLAQTLSQLRATLESTGNGILVLDWRGRITGMNRQFSQMWGLLDALLQSPDEAQVLNGVIHACQESELMAARLAVVVDPDATQDTVHHRDGRVFALGARPQYLGEQIIGRVFSVQDITRQTLDAQALRESRDRLEARVQERTAELQTLNAELQSDKQRMQQLIADLKAAQSQLMQSERMASIGQLAAGVAHEINNPVGFVNSNLSTLQGYVASLLRLLDAYQAHSGALPEAAQAELTALRGELDFDFVRDDVQQLVVESLDGIQRVTRIVQDLKSFSHVDESAQQWADLEAGLESTLRVVWNELKYKAEVVRDFQHPPQVLCYPFQLNQVFMNLLVNAAQAIDTKGRITVGTGFDAQQVWVRVADTGRGIAPEHLAKIFDPFFTTKPVGKGTGLGLSLAYGIVQKHGGHIAVESQLGQGTTFTVFLPRKAAPEVATGGASAGAAAA
ncbi:MAG: hypothetical protein Fur007_19740 [Rhodoferax sp.]